MTWQEDAYGLVDDAVRDAIDALAPVLLARLNLAEDEAVIYASSAVCVPVEPRYDFASIRTEFDVPTGDRRPLADRLARANRDPGITDQCGYDDGAGFCWADVWYEGQGYFACNDPDVNDLGLCARHQQELSDLKGTS